jgi:aconitate hydratase
MVDHFGSADAMQKNAELEFERNQERYAFLRWGQKAFDNFKVVPPDTGIVHQVNVEYLARVVFSDTKNGQLVAYPDTLVGTDSHTTMVNGMGVLGWGVGGIEAEAAMLGQPSPMLIPQVIGFKLAGQMPEGATATDLVLTVTQMLRKKGVVNKFVEFFGPGLDHLPLADRATIANMAPEYGATCGIFPIDQETLNFLALTGRSQEQIALVEAYAKAQGMFREANTPDAVYTDVLELDMSTVVPSLAGPKRPQDRVQLTDMRKVSVDTVSATLAERKAAGNDKTRDSVDITLNGKTATLKHGAVVIAAITSCTNTSNPAVLIAAGFVAKKAHQLGLKTPAWVKTSLAPGSQVVTDYLTKTGLQTHLDAMGFNTVGYGCTTCIGNSGPLPDAVGNAVQEGQLVVGAVLSGNRNFEGRVHADVRLNYLASPPLVVAYALAGTVDIDLHKDPIGTGSNGQPVYLKDIWPSNKEIRDTIGGAINADMYRASFSNVFQGDARWSGIKVPESQIYSWDDKSTYVRKPPYFDGITLTPPPVKDIANARVLCLLGDSITTDHISPAGSIKSSSPAGKYLLANGVEQKDFNSLGARRGNHEVMMRGTFANVRLKNKVAPGTEGGWTTYFPSNEVMSIYDASMKYQASNTQLVIIAGKEYGTGSSRDWAAKGTRLLGVSAVIAESYERIHRSNLVGMGVLPLQFNDGDNAEKLGITGKEHFTISGLNSGQAKSVTVTAKGDDGNVITFIAQVRIDTPKEVEYYQHGGVLHYMLRTLASGK